MNPPSVPPRVRPMPSAGATNGPRRARPLASPGDDTHRAMAAASQPVALWQQLEAVAGALQAIRGGQSGTAALAAVEAGLRPGVQSLLFQVLRQAGRAEALRRQMVARTPRRRRMPCCVRRLRCAGTPMSPRMSRSRW